MTQFRCGGEHRHSQSFLICLFFHKSVRNHRDCRMRRWSLTFATALRRKPLGFYSGRSSFVGCIIVCLLVSHPACRSLSPTAKRPRTACFPWTPNPSRRQCLLLLHIFNSLEPSCACFQTSFLKNKQPAGEVPPLRPVSEFFAVPMEAARCLDKQHAALWFTHNPQLLPQLRQQHVWSASALLA